MRNPHIDRSILCALLALATGYLALRRWPFPEDHGLLQIVFLHKPFVFIAIKWAYLTMLFTTPFAAFSVASSLAYIFLVDSHQPLALAKLPPYPTVAGRQKPFLVVGEVHHPKKPMPSQTPRWLVLPERGLFTGIAIFGAIGSGKTTGCIFPFAEQLLGYCASDPCKRIGGLVLEVKGDFCHKVRGILERHGRLSDYAEIGLDCEYRYNPLHSDLDAYTLAYGIASLMNNLFGHSKEPFWQQAYTNLLKFIILLHKLLYDYVTLFDVYECAINPKRLEERLQEGERLLSAEFLLVDPEDFMNHPELELHPFELDPEINRMKAPRTAQLKSLLEKHRIAHEFQSESPSAAWSEDKRDQFAAVQRWFEHDWSRVDIKLRTSIVEGISVLLSLFDDNPSVKRVFCPPKETYDPVANADGRYGQPLPPFADLIEHGTVCALNFPVAANPGLARAIGTLMKQDFQRAVISRIPHMERDPQRHWREVLFLCDEYQSFATVGESDPSGDEKFFALSRQAKCIPIVATQSISSLRSTLPGESWRTLLQAFRTKIFLALSDDFSAKTASELCGKEEQLKLNYSISEHGQDAGVSVLTGRATAHKSTMGTSKGYNLQRDFVFEPKIFGELKNAQAIVLAYDGTNPWPASYCYLKPYYLDPDLSYFEQLERRLL